MSVSMPVQEVIDSIYLSLANDNADLDLNIANLKQALKDENTDEAVFESAKIAQNNRQGRKLMQAYFRQKGVKIKFI